MVGRRRWVCSTVGDVQPLRRLRRDQNHARWLGPRDAVRSVAPTGTG